MKNNIGFFRKQNGLSMQELAELAGTSQQQIDRLEKGQRKLTAEWMEKLGLALKCKPADLMVFDSGDLKIASKVETAIARVIGVIETRFSNMVRELSDDEQYEISFKPGKKDFGKRFFALLVEGGAYKNYPENPELVFAKVNESAVVPALHQNKGEFIGDNPKENDYKFIIGDKLVEGYLVESIRNE